MKTLFWKNFPVYLHFASLYLNGTSTKAEYLYMVFKKEDAFKDKTKNLAIYAYINDEE